MPQPSPVPGAAGPPPFFPWERALPVPSGGGGGSIAAAAANGRAWYVRVGGSNDNGGSSASLTADRSGADGVCNNTATFTSASAAFTQADVGKGICIRTGANARRHSILAVTNSTTVTLDRVNAISAGSLAWAIGGAWADHRAPLADSVVTSDVYSPVIGGDTVYIGAGTYRVITTAGNTWSSRTLALGSFGAAVAARTFNGRQVTFAGDVTGVYTGDAGMVQWTAYTTNDRTTPSSSTLIAPSGKPNLTFTNLVLVGGGGGVMQGTGVEGLVVSRCSLIMGAVSNCVQLTGAYGQKLNTLFDSCTFSGRATSCITITGASGPVGSADYDIGFTIRNCLFQGGTSGSLIVMGGGSATRGKPGGGLLQNCSVLMGVGSAVVLTSTSQSSTTLPFVVVGNWIVGHTGSNVLVAGTVGQVVEDYNVISTAFGLVNITAGPHSVSGTSYAPLFHCGQEGVWGGTQRPYGEPMQASPGRAFGAPDVGAGPLDIRGVPRPSSPSQWDVGAFQRANSAVQTTTVTDVGTSAVQIVGFGAQDFDIAVDATATSITARVRFDSNYVGPLPQLQVINGSQVGVGDYAQPVSRDSLNAWATYSITINPTAAGIVTLRFASLDTSGVGNAYLDTVTVA